jgi:hypothetical protein
MQTKLRHRLTAQCIPGNSDKTELLDATALAFAALQPAGCNPS